MAFTTTRRAVYSPQCPPFTTQLPVCRVRDGLRPRMHALPDQGKLATQCPCEEIDPSRRLGRNLLAAAAAVVLAASPASAFGPVSVKLENINATQVECQTGVSSVGGVTFSGATQAAACLDISAQAQNPSGKPLYNADVFGRVYDANGGAAIDDTENIRIAYIDEIGPGSSAVHFKLFVPLEQYKLGPLKLVSFKATGFPSKMLPGQGSGLIGAQTNEDCDITGDCEDLEAEAMIR